MNGWFMDELVLVYHYVSFRRAVKRQELHTFKHERYIAKSNISLQTPHTLELDLGPFPPDVAR